ncbi:hypothetical protein MYX65_03200 [Acidobacteria bacterium AH-259-L09]|nr:hypothetical protein [Acidobacteria bacterium AH-259-L09]
MSDKVINLNSLSKENLITIIQGQRAMIDALQATGGLLPGVPPKQTYRENFAGDLPEIVEPPPCILSLPTSQSERDVDAHYAAQQKEAQKQNGGMPDPPPSVIGS